MSLSFYKVLTSYALSIPTNDISGTKPVSAIIQGGSLFIGDTNDSHIAELIARKEISHIFTDTYGYLAEAGLSGGIDANESFYALLAYLLIDLPGGEDIVLTQRLGLYKSLAPYELMINTGDTSGVKPIKTSVAAGSVFVGNINDPEIDKLVADGTIVFLLEDTIGYLQSSMVTAGSDSSYVGQLLAWVIGNCA